MFQEKIGPTRALLQLLDVLPEDAGESILVVLDGTLDRTRRTLIRRLAKEMSRLVASTCEEVASIAGVTPQEFFAFSHPDCPDRICRGSQMEILRVDRAVGGEIACLCRVFRKSSVTARTLRPYRLVVLSGRIEGPHGLIEPGQAVLVTRDEPLTVFSGATFLLPHPMAGSLICHAIQAGFPLRTPGRGPGPLQVVSHGTPLPTDEPE